VSFGFCDVGKLAVSEVVCQRFFQLVGKWQKTL